MPELPEVETVVNYLKANLSKSKILDIKVYRQELRRPIPDLNFLKGFSIQDAKRRAKWPGLMFKDGCLWLHLGMTGVIYILDKIEKPDQHTHLDIIFEDNTILRYRDPRRFGIIDWTSGYNSEPKTSTLGLEPLSIDFNTDAFIGILKTRSKAIKPVLMDGSLIAGVGNIYASEALFLTNIHPDTKCSDLSADRKKVDMLCFNIKSILLKAIQYGGSTLKDYKKPDGSNGNAQSFHNVYGRAGLKCNMCKSLILEGSHGGRATYWCPSCQK